MDPEAPDSGRGDGAGAEADVAGAGRRTALPRQAKTLVRNTASQRAMRMRAAVHALTLVMLWEALKRSMAAPPPWVA